MESTSTVSIDDLLDDTMSEGNKPAPLDFRVSDGAGNKANAIAGDAFEGASRFSREMAMWQPNSRSADLDVLPAKKISDARVRDTLRNDSYVKSGQTLHQDNIVGGQFLLNSKPLTKLILGKQDDKWEEEFQEEVETVFTLTAESPNHWFDATGRNTLTMMIRQAVGTYLATGEMLSVVEWVRDRAASRPCNTAFRMIDLDRLSTPSNRLGEPTIIAGVEVNKRHVPIAYHIRKAHPSDYFRTESYEWERIEASIKPEGWNRLQVAHYFEQSRPNQTRGISDLTTGLKEMRQTKTFRETVLQNAVVNATYAATIESDLNTSDIFARLGSGGTDEYDNAIAAMMGAHLSAVDSYMKGSDQFKIGGVRIPHLPPGSKLNLKPAGEGGPLGTEFEQSLLRHIAASLGLSYEQLSKDYTQTNYSSARAAMTETWKYMQSRKRLVADRFASLVYRLWLEEFLNKGLITSMPRAMRTSTEWLYAPLMLDAISSCEWVGASRGQIDELKETQASVLRLKYNLTTLEDEQGRQGKDWRKGLRQQAREKKMLKDYDLLPPEDNMINAASGSKGATEASSEPSDSSSKDKAFKASPSVDDLLSVEHEDEDTRSRSEK